MGLNAIERVNKGLADKAAEEAALVARAEDIAAGAPLKFSAGTLRAALAAFVDFKRSARRFGGDPRDYLSMEDIAMSSGSPICSDCDMRFDSPRACAAHMMSYRHFLKMHGVAHEAVMEVRAHLHAFPAPADDFDGLDSGRIAEAYTFPNLAADGGVDAREDNRTRDARLGDQFAAALAGFVGIEPSR